MMMSFKRSQLDILRDLFNTPKHVIMKRKKINLKKQFATTSRPLITTITIISIHCSTISVHFTVLAPTFGFGLTPRSKMLGLAPHECYIYIYSNSPTVSINIKYCDENIPNVPRTLVPIHYVSRRRALLRGVLVPAAICTCPGPETFHPSGWQETRRQKVFGPARGPAGQGRPSICQGYKPPMGIRKKQKGKA